MRRALQFALSSALLLFSANDLRANRSPEVRLLSASIHESYISVRATAANLLEQPDMLRRLESGVPLVFTYRFELIRKRPNWFDSTLDTAAIGITVRFDSITREYLITRHRHGRLLRSDSAATLAAVERQIAAVDLPDIFITTRPPSKLRVRARVEYGTDVLLLIIPAVKATEWRQVRVLTQRVPQ